MITVINAVFCSLLLCLVLIGCRVHHVGNFAHLGVGKIPLSESDLLRLNLAVTGVTTTGTLPIVFNKECDPGRIYACQVHGLYSIYNMLVTQGSIADNLKNITFIYNARKGYISFVITDDLKGILEFKHE